MPSSTAPTVRPVTPRHSARRGRSHAGLAAAALVLLALAVPAAAQGTEDPGRWSVRLAGVHYAPAGGSFVEERPAAGETLTYFSDDDGTGFGLFVGYRLGRRWSLEAGALLTEIDQEVRLDTPADRLTDRRPMEIETFLVGVDRHLTPDARWDLSLGLFVAETSFTDLVFLQDAGRREKVVFDDDHGFGAKLAVRVPLGRRGTWFAAADLRYLVTLQEGEVAGQDVDLDPMIATVGIGYRF